MIIMVDDDHAEEERLAVIAKYDRGREDGAQIDDWEDPAFEIYHVTDRYGFIHDRVLPKPKADELKRISVEQERVDKWLKMISPNKWPKFKNSEKLRSRIYKGIPDKMRVSAWKLLLDLDVIKKQQGGKYQEMYLLARKYSQDVRQIDLDVNRTYRDTRMFRERYGKEQKALFNILCAYSVYNSEVGYCQGMSQVAALLLMYMEEEDAFWALSQLMTNPKYGMHGFFIAGFPKLLRFQAHHDKVLKVMLPRLKKHFDKHGVDSGLYTLKWFFQCFLDRVPFELSLRLWDIFLLEGDRVLICGAYAILRMHQKQLLARKNMDDLLGYIQSVIPTNFGVELDKAILNYQQYAEDLRSRKLDTGGEPSDDELPKKPFGVIEIKPAPVKRETVTERVIPKAEVPIVQQEEGLNAISFDEPEDEDEVEDVKAEAENSTVEKAHTSYISTATSLGSLQLVESPNNITFTEGHQDSIKISTVSPTKYPHEDATNFTNGPTERYPIPSAKMNGLSHSVAVRKSSPSPPPPPPRSPQPGVLMSASSSTSSRHTNVSEQYERNMSPVPLGSPSRNNPNFQHSSNAQSSQGILQQEEVTFSKGSKKVPPPVMPRKPTSMSSQVYENHDSGEFGGNNIPSNSEAVRIHVPYPSSHNHNNNNSNSVTLSSSTMNYASNSPAHPASTSSSSSSPVNPRSLDISKTDPNRIKIDVSSHTNSTLIQ